MLNQLYSLEIGLVFMAIPLNSHNGNQHRADFKIQLKHYLWITSAINDANAGRNSGSFSA